MAVDDAFTVALLHMDGADAGTTFTDESGKAWTASGNAQTDTSQSVFGGSSYLGDGTGDYIESADSADWQLDGGDNNNTWTVDFRLRFNGDPGTGTVGLLQQFVDNSNHWEIFFTNNALRFELVQAGATTVSITPSWNPADATWYHVAIVKDGANGYMMFINGTQIGVTSTDVTPIPNFAGVLRVGIRTNNAGSSTYLNGWIDELRISKGVARWTTTFTPPVSAYASGGGFFF
jgi:hypothetical protein